MLSKRILPARSILESIREGLNHEQLMDKYGLSSTALSIVLSRIQGERDRRTAQIIQDFLSGMQIQEIAAKNEFSAERFVEILRVALSLKLGGSTFFDGGDGTDLISERPSREKTISKNQLPCADGADCGFVLSRKCGYHSRHLGEGCCSERY